MKTLSVTIICKNESRNLSRLLPKLCFADEIIVVDTGSDDDTVLQARRFTKKTYFFKWIDDFAAARNYAISKATGDYIMWLDCDDELPVSTVNGIKQWLVNDSNNQDFVYLKYRMGAKGSVWFWRERIIRREKRCRFKGFIHEAIVPFGQTAYLDYEVTHVSTENHSARNLAIYRAAAERGKRFSLRDKYYYARTLVENGLFDEAEPILKKFCANNKAYDVDRVHGFKLLARRALKQNNKRQALKYLSLSAAVLPPDSEICCLFGDAYYFNGSYLYAAFWYETALTRKMQSGFINDYYKSIYPNVQLSVCWWRLGDARLARVYHKNAKRIDPDNSAVKNNDRWFS